MPNRHTANLCEPAIKYNSVNNVYVMLFTLNMRKVSYILRAVCVQVNMM